MRSFSNLSGNFLWSWKRCFSVSERSNYWRTSKKTGGWLRTVQHIKTWQDDGELHLQGQNNILNGRDGRSLKRLVKSAAELTAALNSESKSTPTQTMCKQLKGSGLNSCAALKNPLITEAYL